MGEEEVEFLTGKAVMTREQAISELELAMLLNAQLCPLNAVPAISTSQEILGNEIRQSHYTKASIDFCFVALWTAPCAVNDDTSELVRIRSTYRALLRLCNPEPVSL